MTFIFRFKNVSNGFATCLLSDYSWLTIFRLARVRWIDRVRVIIALPANRLYSMAYGTNLIRTINLPVESGQGVERWDGERTTVASL